MAGANTKLVSARELHSAAEEISDIAEDLRSKAAICRSERLPVIANELDDIAALYRTQALDTANKA